MLPNPARILYPHLVSSNRNYLPHQLSVPGLVNTDTPIFCNDSPITVEHSIVRIVYGNMARARSILNAPDRRLEIDIALIDTHLLEKPLLLDHDYLNVLLEPSRLSPKLQLPAGMIGSIVTEHGANAARDKPAVVSVDICRHELFDV